MAYTELTKNTPHVDTPTTTEPDHSPQTAAEWSACRTVVTEAYGELLGASLADWWYEAAKAGDAAARRDYVALAVSTIPRGKERF